VIVRAHGSARPAVTGREPQSLRRNRRVEISFVQEVTDGR
jgi:outer membrane protein OmpA-like peptidoglycan-associated protein